MSEWEGVPDNIEDYQGFVYTITNLRTGQYYIGQKTFWFKRKLKPLKGRKNKRHKLVESDWKDYWGSSKELQGDVEKYGENAFKRQIIRLCKNKWECHYFELLEQVHKEVLLDPLSYNGIIQVRLRKKVKA